MFATLRNWLAHPDSRYLDIDDRQTTARRRAIIESNRFLARIYEEWYRLISACIPAGPGGALEVGAGAGFLKRLVPDLITSDVFPCPDLDLILDARQLPFATGSLRAISLVDVFHHIPDSRPFLAEAQRCLRPEGSLVMIEPWVTTWSKPIYKHLHYEQFLPDAGDWSFPPSGPLSGANGALPWMVFQRDRAKFEAEFPELEVQKVQPIMPFRYLVSGGVSMRQLMPNASYPFWTKLDSWLSAWPDVWPMFALIHLKRVSKTVRG